MAAFAILILLTWSLTAFQKHVLALHKETKSSLLALSISLSIWDFDCMGRRKRIFTLPNFKHLMYFLPPCLQRLPGLHLLWL